MEDTTYLNHKMWKNQGSADLEASSLLTSFNINSAVGNMYVLKEKHNYQSYPATNPVNYDNYWPNKTWQPV